MHDNFAVYTHKMIQNTMQAITNLFMFFPYFFSAEKLVKTLFAPWKNIVSKKTKPGFSFEELGQRIADNFVSRFMGFMVRTAILLTFVLVQIFLLIALPGIFIGLMLFIPLSYMLYTSQPTPDQKRQHEKDTFMKRHLTEPQNEKFVEEWFELYYSSAALEPWWSLKRLMSQPPLGRDLTSGYTPKLDQFAADVSMQRPHYHHLIGRKAEIERVQQILSKSNEANVILSGDEGVGRRTIVEALAKAIYEGTADNVLVYKRVLELNMERILASSQDFVKREEILSGLFQEAADAKNIILFVDNFDQYISQDKERIDLSNIIEKFGKLPTLQFIGITTPYLYQKYIFANKTIAAIFEKVDVNEVTPNQALTILLDVATDLEKKHGVAITYEALKQAIVQTDRFVTNMPLPEKAIAILDEACVYIKNHHDITAVNAHVINTLIEQKTHVPTEVNDTMKQKLLALEEMLQKKIFHQTEAIHKLSAAL